MTTIKWLKWQKEAYRMWKHNKYKGTVKATTGAGKTLFTILCIKKIIKPPESVLIIVPTIALQKQWFEEIKTHLNIVCGLVGDNKIEIDKQYVIAVINSIRTMRLNFNLVVIDEMHEIGSPVNIIPIIMGKFDKMLALSATPKRTTGNKLLQLLPIIYSYNRKTAIKDNVLSKYNVIFKGIKLTNIEKYEYSIVDTFILKNWYLMKNAESYYQIPWRMKKALNNRRQVISTAENKIFETIKIIKKNPTTKIIIFTEYIKSIDKLKTLLNDLKIKYSVYHSNMDSDERETQLDQYKTDKTNVLITAKALDKGLNVPESNIAVIIAGSKTNRQLTQRLGRILRKSKNSKATVYCLYCLNTVETGHMRKKVKVFSDAEEIIWK